MMTLAPHASGSSSRILSPTSVRLPRVEGNAFPSERPSRRGRDGRDGVALRRRVSTMSLECYPYSSEMRELTGRLKRADISRELDARVERDGVSVVVVEVRDAQNGSCVGADRAGPPDAPGVRASDRTPRPSYSCLLYTSPSPRDQRGSRMPSSA